MTLYENIIDIENLRQAYFELVKKMDIDIKSKRYRGIDGVSINNINFTSEKILKEIQNELKIFKEITPAYLTIIPKKNGNDRRIYVYTIKERIKAEAIYRIVEPIFNNYFSDFLFSYRKYYPSYFAVRSVVRRYIRHHGSNNIFVTDINNYTDSINHEKLLEKLSTMNFDRNTIRLFELFIRVGINHNGILTKNNYGVVSGTPLCGLFSNFFMDSYDKWAGKYVALYRRVGDDIIAMDKDRNKILEVSNKFSEEIYKLDLKSSIGKSATITDSTTFNFLGYEFSRGLVSFDHSSMRKVELEWRKKLGSMRSNSIETRINNLKKLNKNKIGSPNYEFSRILKQKILVNDTEKIKIFSDKIVGIFSSYIFGYNTTQKRLETRVILEKNRTMTIFEQYRVYWNKWK